MLDIIRKARADALKQPRVDLPGAKVTGGACGVVSLVEPALLPSADLTR